MIGKWPNDILSMKHTFHLIKCVKSGRNQPVMSFQVVICSHVMITLSMHCIDITFFDEQWPTVAQAETSV